MIVKILGFLDILSGVLFWFFAFFNIIPEGLILFFAFYLMLKGLSFALSKDFLSLIDISVGALMFMSVSMQFPTIVSILMSLYLIGKGIISLI